jgi:hypothetical protein
MKIYAKFSNLSHNRYFMRMLIQFLVKVEKNLNIPNFLGNAKN